MLKFAILLRSIQIFTHSAHNLCKGATFHEDHGFFGDVYGKAEGWYDSVVERIIGLGYEEQINLQSILSGVAKELSSAPSVGANVEAYYKYLASQLAKSCQMCDEICKHKDVSEGTRQLVGGIADEIEVLEYKIQRRLKK